MDEYDKDLHEYVNADDEDYRPEPIIPMLAVAVGIVLAVGGYLTVRAALNYFFS